VQATGAEGCYYQREETGQSLSLLFLADGRHAWPVGCSEQLAAPGPQPYLFGGVIGGAELSPRAKEDLLAAARRLVAALGLVGLNGIDFLLRGDDWVVLELNPRPTAAIECYDADFPAGLFDWHLRACDGELPDFAYRPATRRGHAIVYASGPLAIDPDLAFPPWCRDIPEPGSRIGRGEPLCSVHHADRDASVVRRVLRQRAAAVENLLQAQPA
jgi:predicted ATP-grasp superfamily ATP-dependent carboligase